MKIIAILILTVAGTAFAKQSPYAKLKGLYAVAQTPAIVSDFTNDDTNPLLCTYVRQSTPNQFSDFSMAIVEAITPGIPSKGPLFPGTPDKIEYKVVPAAFRNKPDLFTNELTDSDFIIAMEEGAVDSPAGLAFRTSDSGRILNFKLDTYIGKEDSKTMYGYCWRGSSSIF